MNVRLVICRDCHSVEPVPPYTGPPEGDVLLQDIEGRHQFPNGEWHAHTIGDIDQKWWDSPSARKQIMADLGLTTGLGTETYATIETHKAEAVKCFNRHRRSIPCIDWEDDSKRIGNPTKPGWLVGPKVYVCHYCPCASYVNTEKRWAAGLYKEQK